VALNHSRLTIYGVQIQSSLSRRSNALHPKRINVTPKFTQHGRFIPVTTVAASTFRPRASMPSLRAVARGAQCEQIEMTDASAGSVGFNVVDGPSEARIALFPPAPVLHQTPTPRAQFLSDFEAVWRDVTPRRSKAPVPPISLPGLADTGWHANHVPGRLVDRIVVLSGRVSCGGGQQTIRPSWRAF